MEPKRKIEVHVTPAAILMLNTAPRDVLMGGFVECAGTLAAAYFDKKGTEPTATDVAFAIEQFIRLSLRAAVKQLRPDMEAACRELETGVEEPTTPEEQRKAEEDAAAAIAKARQSIPGPGTDTKQ